MARSQGREKAVTVADGESAPAPASSPSLALHTPPDELLARAEAVAKSLARVLEERRLFTELTFTNQRTGEVRTSRHISIEGWTTLGILCGTVLGDAVVTDIEWTRPIDGRVPGWEARVIARTTSGVVLGNAEAMVDRSETKWRNAPDHQLRSMAQTRAASKALRLALAWIVAFTDFETTPAEELDHGATPAPVEFDDAAVRLAVAEKIAGLFPNLDPENLEIALNVILNVPNGGVPLNRADGAPSAWEEVGGNWRTALNVVTAFERRVRAGEDPGAAARTLDAYGVLKARREEGRP